MGMEGLEPTRLAAHDSKSCASTIPPHPRQVNYYTTGGGCAKREKLTAEGAENAEAFYYGEAPAMLENRLPITVYRLSITGNSPIAPANDAPPNVRANDQRHRRIGRRIAGNGRPPSDAIQSGYTNPAQ